MDNNVIIKDNKRSTHLEFIHDRSKILLIMSETTKRNTNAKRRLFGQGAPAAHAESTDAVSTTNQTSSSANVVLETPRKARKQQKVNHDFFSPKGKPVVTPDKAEEDDDEVQVVSPPLKKTRLSERYDLQKEEKKEDAYVPTYIHKNLSYKRQGVASLPPKVQKTFELVVENFNVPDDFEQNRSFGPLSGTSYEERVITAYNLSQLEPKEGGYVEICSSCATIGHKRNDCPDLV